MNINTLQRPHCCKRSDNESHEVSSSLSKLRFSYATFDAAFKPHRSSN